MSLPTVPFGDHLITRMIGGGNALTGASHWSARRSAEMVDYHVARPENAVEFLHRLERAGVNAILARGDYHRVLHWMELFRREGGRLTWIAQTASEMHDVFQNIRIIAQAGAAGIYHHGSQTDKFWMEGRIDLVKDYLACIRQTGLQVGLASHIPEVFDYAESAGWDVDYYVCCFYNISRKPRHSELVTGPAQPDDGAEDDDLVPTCGEEFLDGDPEVMCGFIRQTDKQCIAFKILGAGRQCRDQTQVRRAFEFAYANIKPQDAAAVGMWLKHRDEIALNVEHARAALASLGMSG